MESLIDAESLRRVRRGAKRASESARLDALKRHRNDADAAIAEERWHQPRRRRG